MSNKYSASLSAQTNFTIHRRVTATCKLEKYTIKGKSITTFSISMLLADLRILFLRAARGLHDNDSKFFTIERFTLWAEVPAE